MVAKTGRLVNCPESVHGGKVFYVENDRRHWVPSVEHLACYGRSLTEVERITLEEIARFLPAGNLPKLWDESTWKNPPRTSPEVLREIAASQLQGSGIEFGAGTYPFCIPLHCEVRFADFLDADDLKQHAYEAQSTDFVPLSYVTSLEEMEGIPDDSLDFVVACHVIEHLRNPLRALERVYAKLRAGGRLVLVVPDKRLTFDKDRDLTSLEHLTLDYRHPSAERDRPHYLEFFSKVYSVPEQSLEQHVQEAIVSRRDIHFHTWTYESFQEMIEHWLKHITPWSAVWSQPPIEGLAESHEFYFVLQK
jgi:SAM-dependent methyltransferase